MEAIDQFSTVIISIAAAIGVWRVSHFVYKIVTDQPVTIINPRTNKSATITRRYDKNQLKKLSDVLS